MVWVNIMGWIGFVFILGAYFLVAIRCWHVYSKLNQIMNVVGSVCLGVNCAVYKAWVPLTVNVVWSIIAITTIKQLMKSHRIGVNQV